MKGIVCRCRGTRACRRSSAILNSESPVVPAFMNGHTNNAGCLSSESRAGGRRGGPSCFITLRRIFCRVRCLCALVLCCEFLARSLGYSPQSSWLLGESGLTRRKLGGAISPFLTVQWTTSATSFVLYASTANEPGLSGGSYGFSLYGPV